MKEFDQDKIPPQDITEKSILEKIRNSGGKLGKFFVERVLLLYFALRSPQTPKWAKRIIIGALGYFIWPLDAVPDFLPIGFSDDWLTLGAALAVITLYVDEDVKRKTAELLTKWFPK